MSVKNFSNFITRYFLVLLLLFFTFSFLYCSDSSFNQDLGRHLKLGELIVTTGTVPHINLFSFTYPTFPFVNHHWGFEVLLYLLQKSIGLQAVLILKVLFLLLTVAIVLCNLEKKNSVLFFSLSFLFLHLLRGRIELRPEIFSFFFTAITFFLLEKFERSDTKLVYLIPIVSLLWVNIHIYYPVGIALQGIFLLDALYTYFVKRKQKQEVIKRIKILTIIIGISLVCSVINPNGMTGALYAFTVFQNYGVTITENQTIATLQKIGFVNPDFLFFYFCTLIIAISFFIGLVRYRVGIKDSGILLLGLLLGFQSIRGFPYFFLLCLPIVLHYLDFKKSSLWIVLLNGCIIISLFFEAVFYLNGTYYNLTYRNNLPSLTILEDGKPALDFVIKHHLPNTLFNNFDIGSYLIYRLYPNQRVFIDGRPEAYPAVFFEKTYLPMQEEYGLFQQQEQKYHFKTIIFSITDQNPRTVTFLRTLIHDPQWHIVFLDQAMIVLVKGDIVKQDHLPVIALTQITNSSYTYSRVVSYTNLSTFLFNMHYFLQAKIINEKALKLIPDNPAANRIMANILLQSDHPDMAAINNYIVKSKNNFFW